MALLSHFPKLIGLSDLSQHLSCSCCELPSCVHLVFTSCRIASSELGMEVGSCQLSLCTHLHTAPPEGPVEILDSQLPAFGVFHELRAILGGEEQSQGTGNMGYRAPSSERQPGEEADRTTDQRSESPDSSSALMQTTPMSSLLSGPRFLVQNMNTNLLGPPSEAVVRST